MNDTSLEIQMNLMIDSFTTVAISIENIYETLIKLEIDEKKDTEEYYKYMDYLSIAKESEDALYEQYNLSELECNELIKMIIDKRMGTNPINDFDSIILNKNEYNALRRVVNILTFKMNTNKEEKELTDDSEYQKLYLQYLDNLYYKRCIIFNEIQMDLVNSFLLFLEESINDKKYHDIKTSLIKAKYHTCLVFKENENLLIEDNFNSHDKIANYTRMMAYCLSMTTQECNSSIKEKIFKTLVKQIYKMTHTKEGYDNMIIRSCLIRGGLLLIDHSSLYEITDFYNKLHNKENKEADNILAMCFYKMKEDSTKQISLKL